MAKLSKTIYTSSELYKHTNGERASLALIRC